MQASTMGGVAQIVAANVTAAFVRKRGRHKSGTQPFDREALMSSLIYELMAAVPTGDSAVLTAACNRCLDALAAPGVRGPRFASVDMLDGSVTMRGA